MHKRWMLRRRRIDEQVMRKTGISKIIMSILANRGITSEKEVDEFIHPSVDKLLDPFMMKDMDIGTNIICNEIRKNNKIVVYGDYDCDGITSTYILYNGLLRCGADVIYHIPDRIKEGYGMNIKSIEKLKRENISTIITCDNGISALKEIERAKELGMNVIVTDHHDIPFAEDGEGKIIQKIPCADAVINPKQEGCKYPFKMLCGAGVAFKFIQALYSKMEKDKKDAFEFIEYAAIGTICDVVDIVGENRIIAKLGLQSLNNTKNMGLKYLIEENKLELGSIRSYHIGFVLGPCINASGRIESAATSLKLLMADSTENAKELAQKLRGFNLKRQEMTEKSLNEIIYMIENSSLKQDRVIVVYKEDIHESIAGIVAGKLREKYNLPSIVITRGDSFCKGSGRSIDEYDMFSELTKCADLMENFGGHKMAAGMSIKEENIDKLRKRLNDNCRLTNEDIIPKIIIDKRLPIDSISFDVIDNIKSLEPFGKGNPAPVFAEKNIEVIRVYLIGKDKNTLKLCCRFKNTMGKLDAISFNAGEKFKEIIEESYGKYELDNILKNKFKHIFMDMVFSPVVNEYRNNKSIQIIVKDFRISIHN